MDEKPSSSLKQVKEMDEKVTLEHTSLITNQDGDGSDLNAAKVAAMKAAELGGHLSPVWCHKKGKY